VALERLISINLVAPMILCQMFIPLLKQKPEAFILNMGSTFGSIGYPGFSAYAASKFGMRGYTETLRREFADSNIQVMYLAPRATSTPINSSVVIEMNEKLGNAMDDPAIVADALITMLKTNKTSGYIGWPEKLFVRVNSLFPKIVDNALRGKLSTIRDFANNQ
jgi:short-subunit dehydrogenase